ncbi:hypothetical protein XCV3796 [Xanthomonas euvesicatoria pv. vesicatoria str. 85-10]|uniref:Uncharacterized protein n=1 Tax=Xanthomonas euvesicatoria pv. vesicatoria (strain 85-10) TaxID=316273 RepID=Q3BNY6_XANE5|nr:hypothetical protein XCV3796 [Xanthomonas euvesicatoria pv. vesicatoria str. 85-10]
MLHLPSGTAGECDFRHLRPQVVGIKNRAEVHQPHADHVLGVEPVERRMPPGTLHTRGTGQSCDRVQAQQHWRHRDIAERTRPGQLPGSACIRQVQCG